MVVVLVEGTVVVLVVEETVVVVGAMLVVGNDGSGSGRRVGGRNDFGEEIF